MIAMRLGGSSWRSSATRVTTTQYGIDEDRGVVTGITTKSGECTVQSLGFAYDANLNLSDRTDSLTGVLSISITMRSTGCRPGKRLVRSAGR